MFRTLEVTNFCNRLRTLWTACISDYLRDTETNVIYHERALFENVSQFLLSSVTFKNCL